VTSLLFKGLKKERNEYIHQGLIKSDSDVITNVMLQKNIFQINAVLLKFLVFKESWNKNFCIKTFFNIDNNQKYAPNQHIRMISKGSCNTMTGLMADENSALPSQE